MQAVLPPVAFQWVRYLTLHGRFLPLRHPRTFNERLFHKMATDRNPLLRRTSDKADVRGYVDEVLGPGYLSRLYALLERPDEVIDAELPSRYVAKPTHSSGRLMFVERDDPATRARLAQDARDWFAYRHHDRTGEWSYDGLRPRLLVEEWLDDGENRVPPDWKWFCFHGHVGIVECDTGRYDRRARNLLSPDGDPLDATLFHPRGPDIPLPATFREMRRIAEALSRPFDFVRVDLYTVQDRIVVGELTHYPSAGMQEFSPASWDERLGAMWGAASQGGGGAFHLTHQSHHPCRNQEASLRQDRNTTPSLSQQQ